MALTPSEEFVEKLCRRSFLSLWGEANPRNDAGKELCDYLVVCEPDVVIFSVKDIAFKDTGDAEIDWKRWQSRAVDASARQIYGAERWIRRSLRVIRTDGSPGLRLPDINRIRIHRVAVALGSKGAVPFRQGDMGKGFVHVLDEQALLTVLTELDTITDFVDYLDHKETLIRAGKIPIMEGHEEDLLAFYIHRGRKFPVKPDLIIIGDDLWTELVQKPEWGARKEADRISYLWDGLIETLQELHDSSALTPNEVVDSLDSALRLMAREDRFSRRVLAEAFYEFTREQNCDDVRARMIRSLSGIYYVFLKSQRDEDREQRRKELLLRCFVARGLAAPAAETVVGIATERYKPAAGFSLDAVRFTRTHWDDEDQRNLDGIQRDLGYFVSPRQYRVKGDEFPQPTVASQPPAGRNDPCPCGSGRKFKKCHGSRDRLGS